MPEDLSNIEKQRARWIRAINEGSADDFADIIAEDAVWLPAGTDALKGKTEIRSWLAEPFSKLDYDYSVSGIRLRTAGEWAIEMAKFTTRTRTKSGEALPPHEGRYTLLWKKSASGRWLIERYIDHSADFKPAD